MRGKCIFTSVIVLMQFLLISTFAFSQKAGEDFEKVNEAYIHCDKLSFDILYEYFDTYTSTKPTESLKGKVIKSGENTYSNLYDIETIINQSHRIIIDKNRKVMLVNKVSQTGGLSTKLITYNIDSLLQTGNEVSYFTPKAGQKGYEISFEGSDYKSISIIFNSKTYFIEKIIIYLRKGEDGSDLKPRIEVSYKNINRQLSIKAEFFSSHRFFQAVNGSYKLQAPYQLYRLIN